MLLRSVAELLIEWVGSRQIEIGRRLQRACPSEKVMGSNPLSSTKPAGQGPCRRPYTGGRSGNSPLVRQICSHEGSGAGEVSPTERGLTWTPSKTAWKTPEPLGGRTGSVQDPSVLAALMTTSRRPSRYARSAAYRVARSACSDPSTARTMPPGSIRLVMRPACERSAATVDGRMSPCSRTFDLPAPPESTPAGTVAAHDPCMQRPIS